MAILVKGHDFSPGDQVTDVNLEALVGAATFASGAVDGTTTQLSSGAIIVKDGGITPAKLSSGGPTWAGNILTITQGLNVGNDAQPGMPVNINGGASGPMLTFRRSGTSCGTIRFDSDTYEFDSTTSQPLVFKVNGTERVRVDNIGNVGIGVTPAHKLHVAGTGADIAVTDSAVGTRLISSNAGGAGFVETSTNHPLVIRTNQTERMRIKADGKINISSIPTSASGLASGDIWSDGGTLKIVT